MEQRDFRGVRRRRLRRMCRLNAVLLLFALLPALSFHPVAAADQLAADSGLIVAVHSPKTAPADFLVEDPRTGTLQPYVVFDESHGGNQRIRVRIHAPTIVGYQDFVFDSTSQTMSIQAGDETLLERFEVVTEERQGAGWKRSSQRSQQFSYTLQPHYAEIVWTREVAPLFSQKTTFQIGFDGTNPIHLIDSELVSSTGRGVPTIPGKGQASSVLRRAWFSLQGLPTQITDGWKRPSPGLTEDEVGQPEALEFGELEAEWLGPTSAPFERRTGSTRTVELSASDVGTAGISTMSMSLGVQTSGSTITVTSPGQFEVIFSSKKGGGIQYWYDLANDPGRTENLVYNNTNLFAHRIKVNGAFHLTSKSGQVEVVSQDAAKVVIRQFGTYNKTNSTLTGTTYEIVYTIWVAGQIGINLTNATTVQRTIDIEEHQLQVSADPWQGFDEFGNVSGNRGQDEATDYVGFYLNGGTGSTLNADVVLTKYMDWADANSVFYRSQSAGRAIGWKNSADVVWPAGFNQSVEYLLQLRPDTINGFDQPLPYVADYRQPSISVTTGTSLGFDPGSAAYGIQADSNRAVFFVGNGVTRFQPRFAVTDWSEPDWKLTHGGTLLVNGIDYIGALDESTMTLNIEYLGNQLAGNGSSFALEPVSTVPRITTMSPPSELDITDEGGTFAIPYIQESTSLNVTVMTSNLPAGGGIEFILDGVSTFDMTAPFTQSYTVSLGEHSLEAYIVDSSQTRLSNPEAHAVRPQIGIGTLWSTIGDSITAGNEGDSSASPISQCAQSPSWSPDCRNFFQHSASSGIWYRGYQVRANECLTTATGTAQFLMNEGYGGITTQGVLNRMDVYTTRIQQLGLSHVLLLIGTNDGNQLVPVNEWKSNVESIIGNLVAAGIEPENIYLGHVPYRLGNSDGAQARRQRMQEYNAQIPTIAADTGVNVGPDFYSYFETHQDQMADNFHPTQAGYDAMAGLWTQSVTGSAVCVP